MLTQADLGGKRETASRVRQRIAQVLEYAAKREGEPHRYNPAESYKLPKRKGSDKVKHHAAARWQDVPTIMAKLRERDATSAFVLRWSILSAGRSGEARGALWSEIDREARTWTLPPERMKAREPHRVWLCDEALAILEAMEPRKVPRSDLVFPGARGMAR